MAAVTLLGAQTLDTNSGTKTVTATPAVGDLIVICTAHTGNTSAAAPTDNNSAGGGTYTQIGTGFVKAASVDQLRFWIRDRLIGSATSTVFSHAPGTSTGGGLGVIKVTGLARTGLAAVRQSAGQSNQAAAGTPTATLAAAALTGNALIGACFNATSPATLTPRTSFAELFDVGYATPTTGLEMMSRDSGETVAAQAWGGTSASAFCDMLVELDCSAEVPPVVANMPPPQPPVTHEGARR